MAGLKLTFLLMLTIQMTSSSVKEKTSMLNDDEYLASSPDSDLSNDKPISRDVFMSDAVRRGIEKMIEESPFHRSKIQTQALIEKIGELLIHPPAKQHEPDMKDAAKKSYVDEQHFISTNVEREKDETKEKTVNKKDTVDRNRENIGNLLYTKEETRRDNNKEAAFSKKKEVVINEHHKKNKKIKYDFDLEKSVSEDNDAKKKEEIENENEFKVNEKEQKLNESESKSNDSDVQLNDSRRKEAIASLPPFEGYMRKLAGDVNGVMGDATEMLRDTGKLIKGLKRVVKGASTLSRVTNDAVKFSKYFSSEPENITVDFLEEKAIIALLDAQRAANESRKAANLARIASAKAVDVERRVESSEPDLQDVKLVRPYVEATEILTGKAEKAAKLAKIEKKKTEKDFVQMNDLLNKLKAKRRSDFSPGFSSSTEIAKKQKELELELANFKDEIEPLRKSLPSGYTSDSKLHTKASQYESAVKKSNPPRKDIIATDLGKDAMSSIATELTKTINQSPTSETQKENTGSKKDIVHPGKESTNAVTREISDNVGKEVPENVEKTITVKITTDAAKILDAAAAEEEQKERENAEEEDNTSTKMPRKLDAEQTFGDILRDSIENRDKIMTYLSGQFSPQSPLSEDVPELKVNPEDNGESSETITRGADRKSNIVFHDHKIDNKAAENVKTYSGNLPKNDRNVILDYIDQDDASGDLGSPERTIYKNVRDNAVASRNKYRAVSIVDRSNIPKQVQRNETAKEYRRKEHARSAFPKTAPMNASTNTQSTVSKNVVSLITPQNRSLLATHLLSNDSLHSPASINPAVKDEIGYKKSTIPTTDDAYDNYDPFGFKKFEEQMKGQYGRRSLIPRVGRTSKKLIGVKKLHTGLNSQV